MLHAEDNACRNSHTRQPCTDVLAMTGQQYINGLEIRRKVIALEDDWRSCAEREMTFQNV
jgi:hypothetical protein